MPELPYGKKMGKKRKCRKFCLSFVMLFIVSVVLIGNAILPVKAAGLETYTTFFDTDGGECEVESITVEKGESLTLPPATLEGFHFFGWLERLVGDDGGTHFFQVWPAGQTFTPKEDGPLYAVWKIIVRFEAGDGTCAETEIMAGKNEEIILPDASREGFDFTGWYKDENRQEYAGSAGERYVPGISMTLYAGWEEDEKDGGDGNNPDGDEKYTVTFDTDGGKVIAPVQVVKGSEVKLPSAEKEGSKFLGWYTEKNGGVLLGLPGEGIIVNGDMTVYALWEKDKETGDNAGEGENEGDGGNKGEGNDTENPPAGPETDGNGSGEKTDGSSESEVYLDTDVNSNGGYSETEDRENVENTENADSKSVNALSAAVTAGVEAEEAGAQEDTGKVAEPVIQTGRISLAPAAVVIGIYGALLVAAAWGPGKKKRDERK